MENFLDTEIEYLKGVGPGKATLLQNELNIYTCRDLLFHFPFRYEDRMKVYPISSVVTENTAVQVKGILQSFETVNSGKRKRLVATIKDESGSAELVWFQKIHWIQKQLKPGKEYLIFGKPKIFQNRISWVHPEMEAAGEAGKEDKMQGLHPVYRTTEKLKTKYIDSKALVRLMRTVLEQGLSSVRENLPNYLLREYSLMDKRDALANIHFPANQNNLEQANFRLKFEELFFLQLQLLKEKDQRKARFRGQVLNSTELLNTFYQAHLPFSLTEAQKRVIKEIYQDLGSGQQMNRLLQGDVGSGKTIVAFMAMLMVIGSGAQACLMAPTEVLADQHYENLKTFADLIGIKIEKLTGSTRKKDRQRITEELKDNSLKILVGTHALIEDYVQFYNLGLCVVDEQHRFGVAQRAKLWNKNNEVLPHVLVMTATPIPRTLAMTLYGDLDVSVIDQLPAGRKPIITVHRYDSSRLRVFGFIQEQINKGHQAYIVYPLVEESEKMDYKNLMEGYENIARHFNINPAILHGRMKPEAKEYEMERFVKKETPIMVSTTVIEVGVDVPGATIMVIENAERFGLSQLHQLRGRVGRGADQSYCILMSKENISSESQYRLQTLTETNDGFRIADADMRLRGPGNLSGTQQSGALQLSIADLSEDGTILRQARDASRRLLNEDPELADPKHQKIRKQIASLHQNKLNWHRIS